MKTALQLEPDAVRVVSPGQLTLSVAQVTCTYNVQLAVAPQKSVALNIMGKVVPSYAAVACQEKVNGKKLPVVGNGGVVVAPIGSPLPFKVTMSPRSASRINPVTVRIDPTCTLSTEPQADESVMLGGLLPTQLVVPAKLAELPRNSKLSVNKKA